MFGRLGRINRIMRYIARKDLNIAGTAKLAIQIRKILLINRINPGDCEFDAFGSVTGNIKFRLRKLSSPSGLIAETKKYSKRGPELYRLGILGFGLLECGIKLDNNVRKAGKGLGMRHKGTHPLNKDARDVRRIVREYLN